MSELLKPNKEYWSPAVALERAADDIDEITHEWGEKVTRLTTELAEARKRLDQGRQLADDYREAARVIRAREATE